MLITKSWIESHYNKFNELYFGNSLPRIEFKVSRSRNSWGFASFRYDYENSTIIPLSITISNYYDSPEEVKIQTLLHEMIHIEDYMWHPEHFIRNGKKVTSRYYDAHGPWFRDEARRITEESGYSITKYVSREEVNKSSLSSNSQRLLNNKMNTGRIICASNGHSMWMFKTDIDKLDNVKKLIKWQIPNYSKITEYKFNSPELANKRSCNTQLSGWHVMRSEFMNKARQYKFTTIKTYHI